jgi:hypothetical protein
MRIAIIVGVTKVMTRHPEDGMSHVRAGLHLAGSESVTHVDWRFRRAREMVCSQTEEGHQFTGNGLLPESVFFRSGADATSR